MADYYSLQYYELHELKRASSQFNAAKLQFVLLGWGDQEAVLAALTWITTRFRIPTIVTGPASEQDCVAMLEGGATEYISDTMSPRESLARIRAVLRFHKPLTIDEEAQPSKCIYAFRGWEYDHCQRYLTNAQHVHVNLTRSESLLLKAFLDAPQRTLTREFLIRATRVLDDIQDRSLDIGILRLRRKLSAGGANSSIVHTERGVGYQFTLPVERKSSPPRSFVRTQVRERGPIRPASK